MRAYRDPSICNLLLRNGWQKFLPVADRHICMAPMPNCLACTPMPNAFAGRWIRPHRQRRCAGSLDRSACSTNPSSTCAIPTETPKAAGTTTRSLTPSGSHRTGLRPAKAKRNWANGPVPIHAQHSAIASAVPEIFWVNLSAWPQPSKKQATQATDRSQPVPRQHRMPPPAIPEVDAAARWRRQRDPQGAGAEPPATASRPAARCRLPPPPRRLFRLVAQLPCSFPFGELKHALDGKATMLYAIVSMLSP